MADYEITGIRQGGMDGRTHHIEAVKVGESLFLVDQIIDWTKDEVHRFWIWFQEERIDIVALQHGSSRRFYLTVDGGGFPPAALLSLPRV
ncbi:MULTISPECIES: hypothetical protein [Sphingopyxis]|jgi:hypothetical protein|uniref:Uncharacterized protein n=1 Tax=Sphingopyxis panaciterrulae TaxID=462372 RepID=A0A7W9B5L8_9SPHN|nr:MULTISPECIES: hypothetical protein [Sphingopyxis]MBB5706309.1 hypothetical protein [Sphingopyxis panaciterrulae]MCW0197180.1 hypothetical protein [Sphingopyxis sp.]PAL20685.1 hypothetical protein CD928_16280 [Sphingopyxis sp. GW247-27LB]QUM71472.1 hypothetical protein ICN83_14130 [Sphingopyxis granuli]HEX2811893.1 hypothetical protein [Sphingopyxis sp.]